MLKVWYLQRTNCKYIIKKQIIYYDNLINKFLIIKLISNIWSF